MILLFCHRAMQLSKTWEHLSPNVRPQKLTENTPFVCSALCIHFVLIAGVSYYVLITEKHRPDTVPHYPSSVYPQQQNCRNKLCWFKGDGTFLYTSQPKMAPKTAKTVLLGYNHVVICVKQAPDSGDHSANAPEHWWLTQEDSGLMNSQDWPPSSLWEAEWFISRGTGCTCVFTTHESTCSVKSKNFNLKSCKHHKHRKHFKIKLHLPLLLSLWHMSPRSAQQTHSHKQMYCFVPGVVNEALLVMLLKYFTITQVISAQERCSWLLSLSH